uniref:Transcription factor 24 n=1 Tax=Sphaeramia orbicularis TaxID=375764 RepID=A0A672YCZ7_9TELE
MYFCKTSKVTCAHLCGCDLSRSVKYTRMVGRHTLRMDSGNCSGVVVDDSPASSPSSSPSPDGRRRELHRARVLQAGGLGGRGRPAAANAARERSRVQTLRNAFLELQRTLPSVPPDTKLSKLDVLILATTYIAHLTRTLQEEGYLHPVKRIKARRRPPPNNRLKSLVENRFNICMSPCCLL